MRIAYVIADRGIPVFGEKGASIHVREMVKAFTDLGHHVTLIVVRRGDSPGELENTEVIEVSSQNNEGPAKGANDKTFQREKQSIEINQDLFREIEIQHRHSPFSFIYERYTLFGTAGLEASKKLGIPLVLEVNSPLLREQQEYRQLHHLRMAEQNERDLFNRSFLIAAVSEEMRKYIISKTHRGDHIEVIPNGVDDQRFHPDVKPTLIPSAQARKVIGFVGSLKPWHDIKTLLDAFRSLKENRRDVHLLIVGDGPLREWIEGFICGAQMSDCVTITGWTDHIELPGFLKTMDIAVAPYPELEDFYFSPLKLYEYMAVGTPVIASRIGQISTVIVDEQNGLLFSPGNAEELKTSLEKLLDNPALREKLGRSAANSVVDRTWRQNACRILESIKRKTG